MPLSHFEGHGDGHGRSTLLDPLSLHGSVWDPFEGIRVLDGSPPPSAGRQYAKDAHAVANTRVDWRETPEAHIFKADLPGLKKDEVIVQVVDGKTLEISGDRKKEDIHKGDTWHRLERVHGTFLRRFRLPDNTLSHEVKAMVQDGVLTVTIPKAQKPKPHVLHIEVL